MLPGLKVCGSCRSRTHCVLARAQWLVKIIDDVHHAIRVLSRIGQH